MPKFKQSVFRKYLCQHCDFAIFLRSASLHLSQLIFGLYFRVFDKTTICILDGQPFLHTFGVCANAFWGLIGSRRSTGSSNFENTILDTFFYKFEVSDELQNYFREICGVDAFSLFLYNGNKDEVFITNDYQQVSLEVRFGAVLRVQRPCNEKAYNFVKSGLIAAYVLSHILEIQKFL